MPPIWASKFSLGKISDKSSAIEEQTKTCPGVKQMYLSNGQVGI